jgi:hypothetical protein
MRSFGKAGAAMVWFGDKHVFSGLARRDLTRGEKLFTGRDSG